jgi:ABC-2 type transport system permease protein
MSQPYNQRRALLSITRASFTGVLRSPQTTFFSLFFPIVLIVIFGSLGGGGGVSYNVGMAKDSDSLNLIYQRITHAPIFSIAKGTDAEVSDKLKRGKITAILRVTKNPADSGHYLVNIISSSASQRELPGLQNAINGIILETSEEKQPIPRVAELRSETIPGRAYKLIDFLLPGMIGFSLIGSAVFGVAFVFFNYRETLVLKRMYASPASKSTIVIGESLGRVIFLMITVVVLILFGKYIYHFTLANGFVTFLELLAMSAIGLIVFMGFGFFISSLAKNQNVIPIYANLFMFPQYFLSGTFFPKTSLPTGVQWLIEILPLTALNDGLRKISFEGAHLYDCWKQIGILTAWGIAIYIIAVRIFKWE